MRRLSAILPRTKRWVKLTAGKWTFRAPSVSQRLTETTRKELDKVRAGAAESTREARGMHEQYDRAMREWQERIPEDMILTIVGVQPRKGLFLMHGLRPEYNELPADHPAKVAQQEVVRTGEELKRGRARWTKKDGLAFVELRKSITPILVRRTLAWMGIRDAKVRKEIVEAFDKLLSWEEYQIARDKELSQGVIDQTDKQIHRALGKNHRRFTHLFARLYSKALKSAQPLHA